MRISINVPLNELIEELCVDNGYDGVLDAVLQDMKKFNLKHSNIAWPFEEKLQILINAMRIHK